LREKGKEVRGKGKKRDERNKEKRLQEKIKTYLISYLARWPPSILRDPN
jgi:hypothetical protein